MLVLHPFLIHLSPLASSTFDMLFIFLKQYIQNDDKKGDKDHHHHRSPTSISKQIDEQIKKDRKASSNCLTLLLLGTGDSGKSTLMKQTRVAYMNGYTKEECVHFADVLRTNCLHSMQILCQEALKTAEKYAHGSLKAVLAATQLTKEVADIIDELWPTAVLQEAVAKSHLLSLPGAAANLEYFMLNAKRFSSPDYVPTQNDIVRSKVVTTGFQQVHFSVNNLEFKLIDVGGQRSFRKKWINFFSDCSAVIYIAALDEYDMLLAEDGRTNRMEESLKTFQQLTRMKIFESSSFILLLNKSDKFKEKIKKSPLENVFEDYPDFIKGLDLSRPLRPLDDFEKGCEYIKSQYIDSFSFNGSRLYPFIVCLMEEDVAVKIFAVSDSVISGALAIKVL